MYSERAVTGDSAKKHCTLSRPAAGQLRPQAVTAFREIGYGCSSLAVRQQQCSKYKALLQDLQELRRSEGGAASVVIFTHYNEVLSELCEMLRSASNSQYLVYEVSRKTDPGRRHSALRAFQGEGGGSSAGSGAATRVFATTYATAAVGLTLTAASRVYLLESSISPAEEAQAAGRIHRLGQTKEVLVKRFFFRESVDEAIHELHQGIRDGKIEIKNGKFPDEALEVFRSRGVAMPHKRKEGAPLVEAQRRYRSSDKHNVQRHGGEGGFDYGKTVKTQACECCNAGVEVPGTSAWWGRGKWKHLGLDGCTDDYPACLKNETEHFNDAAPGPESDDD